MEKEVKLKPPFFDQNPVRHGELREIIKLTVQETLLLAGYGHPLGFEGVSKGVADKILGAVYRNYQE